MCHTLANVLNFLQKKKNFTKDNKAMTLIDEEILEVSHFPLVILFSKKYEFTKWISNITLQ